MNVFKEDFEDEEKWYEKYLDFISEQWHNLYYWFYRRIDQTKYFFFWGWNLRNNWDCDGTFLYQIINIKLKRILKSQQYHKDIGLYVPDKDLKRIKTAIELSERLFWDENERWHEMWKDKDYKRTKQLKLYDKLQKIRKFEKDYLYCILNKYLEKWWF